MGSASASISALPEIYRYVEGRKMKRQAQNILDKTVRPDYVIPQSETDAYAASRYNLATNSAGVRSAQSNAADRTQGAQVAAGLVGGRDSAGTLAYLTAVDVNRNAAVANTERTALAQKAHDLQVNLTQAARYGALKDKEWDWNKKTPYEDAMLAASSLMKAGKENTFNAINNIAKLGASEVAKGEDIAQTAATGMPTDSNSKAVAGGAGAATPMATGVPEAPQAIPGIQGYNPTLAQWNALSPQEQQLLLTYGLKAPTK